MQATSWRKSSRSSDNANPNCVECRVTWRKSSRSSASGADQNCVEARSYEGQFQVRDSKLGHDSPVFDLAASEFASLLRATSVRLPRHKQAAPGRGREPLAFVLHPQNSAATIAVMASETSGAAVRL
jgi:hypothetical protein